ncbi:family 10 glycosylhydrolase [Cohnella sp.]|uniref:family 10 glycosylhydrolase n=1 Tax=Cohnella sp. TaxID=1883426 RepID=UPI00356629D0
MTRSLFSLNKSLSILLVISLIASVFTVVAAQPAYGAEQQLDSETVSAEADHSYGETPPGEDGGEGEQPLPGSDEESQGNDSEDRTELEPAQPPDESDPFDELTPPMPLAEPFAAPGAGWKLVFEDFEDISDLRATGAQANANVLTQASRPEPVKYGSKSAKLEYDFLGMSGTSAAYIRFRNTLGADGRDIPGAPTKIGFWIYGEDKAHWIRGQVQGDGQAGVTIDFNAAASVINGWKYVTADIPPTVASPMKLNFIYVVETGAKSSGKIYVDDLSILYENTDLFALEWANVAPMTVGETRAGRVLATRKNDAEPKPVIGGLTYSSSDENVAAVDGNGIITAHHAGETELTALYNDRYPAVHRLVVTDSELIPDEVQIEGPASMVLTETGLLKAYAVFNGAEPVDVSEQTVFTAEPGNPVAHVSGRTIQAAAVGHIEITATYRGVSRSYTLEAKAGELKTIEIRGVFSAIVGGEPVTAKVFGDYKVEGYKEIPSGATFSSDNPAIASIDPVTGVIVGAAPGTTSIKATYEGQLARQMIVVTNPVSYPKRELRGAWISTVENIDWPNATDFDPEKQRADYVRLLDELKATGINAVFTQIRPTSDSFYPSEYFPWSHWLTGEQGKPPSDGYDPLGFIIEEAHKRNIEFHAWINPYRISMHADPSRLASNHPARFHPDWVVSNGGKLYFNPGIPEAKDYIIAGVKEIVEKYDVDGIHMDDYFYPYPGTEEFNDAREYNAYRNGGGTMNLADWRRNNVNDIVRDLHTGIKGLKPYVKFGISPFGIWRNKGTDPTGSDTTGQQNYDGLYADTRTWIKQGWIDYIAPQIYWHFGYSAAAYEKLIDWWTKEINGQNDNSGKHAVHLYIGQAPYRVGVDANWTNPDQLPAQLRFNRDRGADVSGSIMFSSSHLLANPLGVRDTVASMYSRPALIPVMPWLTGVPLPEAPEIAGMKLLEGGRQIGWRDRGEDEPAYYAIYRIQGAGTPDPGNPAHLLATVRRTEGDLQLYTDSTAADGEIYTYALAAVNRLHQESVLSSPISEPSNPIVTIEIEALKEMKSGQTQQARVFGLTSMGDRVEIVKGTAFASSSKSVAGVNASGWIRAHSKGKTVIAAEYGGLRASRELIVVKPGK